MRPTGRLHIGHYFGALQNWVRLQDDPSYDCFYFIADWHALTSDYADTSGVAQNVIEIATDYLGVGLDPKKCVIFQQSQIPEHAELHLLLSMVTPLGWLERVPTYKEALENVKDKDLHTYGFLGYPCLQTADIVIYSQEGMSLVVPVGEDQVSHVELSREIVRRFNSFYEIRIADELFSDSGRVAMERLALLTYTREWNASSSHERPLPPESRVDFVSRIRREILTEGLDNFLERIKVHKDVLRFLSVRRELCEPEAMLTQTPRIPGLDGRKMSKSYGNAIMLSESDGDIRAKTKVMVTDPARKRRSDPGNPDVCPVYDWHKLFAPRDAHEALTEEGKATLKWSADGCRTAGIGCIECKAAMADNLIKWITPIRERRVQYEKNPKQVLHVIDEGSQRARSVAVKTMERVREAVFAWQKKRNEIADESSVAKA